MRMLGGVVMLREDVYEKIWEREGRKRGGEGGGGMNR